MIGWSLLSRLQLVLLDDSYRLIRGLAPDEPFINKYKISNR